ARRGRRREPTPGPARRTSARARPRLPGQGRTRPSTATTAGCRRSAARGRARARNRDAAGGAGSLRPGLRDLRPCEQVGDHHRADHGEDAVHIHRRYPAHLAVLDGVDPGRAATDAEATALTLLALLVVPLAAPAATADGGRGDHGHAVLL